MEFFISAAAAFAEIAIRPASGPSVGCGIVAGGVLRWSGEAFWVGR
jgi:hypothetical protein